MKRFALAVAVAFFITLVVDLVLNAIVFRQVYVEASGLLLPPSELNLRVPLGWGAMLIIMVGYALIYRAGGWPWPSGALRFGAIIAVMGVAGVLGIASVFPWPPALVAVMAIQQGINAFILALVLGWVGRNRTSLSGAG